MAKKKVKTGRKGKRKGNKEDVKASTSLPPAVDGQLRCFLRVSLSKIIWTTPKPPDAFLVRLKWWGETGEGTLFRPYDGREQTKSAVQTTARFPIRCGPKQFTAYVHDMGTANLEIIKPEKGTVVGKAIINEIGLLSPQIPVIGNYPVFSTQKSERIADISVCMKFEPLPASYDSSSSVPTTDVSLPVPHSHMTDTSSIHPSNLKEPMRTSSRRSTANQVMISSIDSGDDKPQKMIPRGVDSDFSFVIGPGADLKTKPQAATSGRQGAKSVPQKDISSNLTFPEKSLSRNISTGSDSVSTDAGYRNILMHADRNYHQNPKQVYELNPSSKTSKDLISALLDRGTKLRDHMIKAEVETKTNRRSLELDGRGAESAPELGFADMQRPPLRRSSSGDLFRELLKPDGSPDKMNPSEVDKGAEERTVELVIGDKIRNKDLKALKVMQMGLAISDDDLTDDDMIDSDSGDPLHEESILEELFYKGRQSSSDDSIDDLLLSSDTTDSEDGQSHRRVNSKKQTHGRKKTGYHKNREDSDGIQEVPSKSPSNDQENGHQHRSRASSAFETEDLSKTSLSSSTTMLSVFGEPADIEGLSVQRLTLLGRIHAARVSIGHLRLDKSGSQNTPSRIPTRVNEGSKVKGKPPRPHIRNTYFLEYQFPVVAAEKQSSLVSSLAAEVMRVVSKKVNESEDVIEVQFGHRSVFPVQFDGSTVDYWWTKLIVFKLFRKAAGQKTPLFLGVASIPLKSILQSPDLAVDTSIQVKDKQSNQSERTRSATSVTSSTSSSTSKPRASSLGSLQVSVELASEGKDFKAALARTKVAEMKGAKIISLPSDTKERLYDVAQIRIKDGNKEDSKIKEGEDVRYASRNMPNDVAKGVPLDFRRTDIHELPNEDRGAPKKSARVMRDEPEAAFEGLTLHTLLLIPEGRGINLEGVPPSQVNSSRSMPFPIPCRSDAAPGRDMTTCNTYLVCRMFWSDDVVNSNICWGTSEPNYEFSQVAPVLLTPSLLERVRNNFVVIEVWDKKTSAQNDQLVGISKLALHQFYMSFRDRKIAETLLKSQYPVVGVDTSVPVIDPFTGVHYGQLKVLLAMGAIHQISALQRIKGYHDTASHPAMRPDHYLERGQQIPKQENQDVLSSETEVEHVFEVVIEGIRGFPQLENSVWGEADCFVQYYFPVQEQKRDMFKGLLNLKSFRTATTLCLPDPAFHDVTRHRIVLQRSMPVQKELLTACVGVGGGSGGVPFEVWCRFYYPNVRDQVVAKTSLPLAKLCAMVTMQRRGEPSIQTFCLPLRAHLEESSEEEQQKEKVRESGLLDVTVNYKQNHLKRDITLMSSPLQQHLSSPHVCLSVGVIRACGLQGAAQYVSKFHPTLQYPSEVGVNCYVTLQVSFLSNQEIRKSRTIARSFAPEFSHHVDFPSPLVLSFLNNELCDSVSLAEALETADLIIKVWHQVPGLKTDERLITERRDGSGRQLLFPTDDILLCWTSVPLQHLLLKRTGIRRWFLLHIQTDHDWEIPSSDKYHSEGMTDAPTALQGMGGGVELSLNFAHNGDKEKVIDAGRRMGWAPQRNLDHNLDDLDEGEDSFLHCETIIQVDRAWFSEQSALRPGQKSLDPSCKAYLRYKFHDHETIASKLCYLDAERGSKLSADFHHAHSFYNTLSEPFLWYLREESLELQLWLIFDTDPSVDEDRRPRQRDKLIGCVYIDMYSLCEKNRRKSKQISGFYPLFKPGTSNLFGACMRVHITMKMDSQATKSKQKRSKPSRAQVESSEEDCQGHLTRKEGEDVTKVEELLGGETDQTKDAMQETVLQPVLVEVDIDRAMHLNTSPHSSNVQSPSTYVTFQVVEDPCELISTPTIADAAHPLWNFCKDVLLPVDLLEKQNLIFKVWHQTTNRQDTSCDRMLGFVSVDLGPLLAGFRSLNGWYNIIDFSGVCKGQIKISITPKQDMSAFKSKVLQSLHPLSSTSTPGYTMAFLPPISSGRTFLHPPSSYSYTSPHSASSQKNTNTSAPSHFERHYSEVKSHYEKRDHHHHHQTSKERENRWGNLEEQLDSKSLLLDNLRKNLADLDALQIRLKSKLTGLHGSHDPQNTHEKPMSHSYSTSQPNPQTHTKTLFERKLIDNVYQHQDGQEAGFLQRQKETEERELVGENHQSSYDDVTDEDKVMHLGDQDRVERFKSASSLPQHKDDASLGMIKASEVDRRSYDDLPSKEVDDVDELAVLSDPERDKLELFSSARSSCSDYSFVESDKESDIVIPRPLNSISSYGLDYESEGADVQEVSERNLRSETEENERRQDESSHISGKDGDVKAKNIEEGLRDVILETGRIQSINTHDEGDVDEGDETPEEALKRLKDTFTRINDSAGVTHDRRGHRMEEVDGDEMIGAEVGHRDGINPERHRKENGKNSEKLKYRTDVELQEGQSAIETELEPTYKINHTMRGKNRVSGRRNFEDEDAILLSSQIMSSDQEQREVGQRSSLTGSEEGHDDVGHDQREDDNESLEVGDEDSVVLTISPDEVRKQQLQEDVRRTAEVESEVTNISKEVPVSFQLPNFFLPPAGLAESMRALQTAISHPPSAPIQHSDSLQHSERFEAARELSERLGSSSQTRRDRPGLASRKLTYKPPTAEAAKRIAKILSTKYSP